MESRKDANGHVEDPKQMMKKAAAEDRIKALYKHAIRKTSVDKAVVRCTCDC